MAVHAQGSSLDEEHISQVALTEPPSRWGDSGFVLAEQAGEQTPGQSVRVRVSASRAGLVLVRNSFSADYVDLALTHQVENMRVLFSRRYVPRSVFDFEPLELPATQASILSTDTPTVWLAFVFDNDRPANELGRSTDIMITLRSRIALPEDPFGDVTSSGNTVRLLLALCGFALATTCAFFYSPEGRRLLKAVRRVMCPPNRAQVASQTELDATEVLIEGTTCL